MTAGATGAGRQMVRELLAAHAELRGDLAALRKALDILRTGDTSSAGEVRALIEGLTMRQNAWQLRSFCDFYCRKVHLHHSIEDSRIFPAILRAAPELGPVVDSLEADHRQLGVLLNTLMDTVSALPGPPEAWTAAEAAATELTAHLETHLALEEESIIPHLGRLPAWV